MKRRWIQLGIVGKAHGLNGAFFISHRDEVLPPQVKELRIGRQPETAVPLKVQSCRLQGDRPLLQCVGLSSREAAEKFLLQEIWCEREALPIDEHAEYLWADLVGKEVRDARGLSLGHVAEVGNFGASDIVRIVHPQRGVLEVPFVAAYFDMNFQSHDAFLQLLVEDDCFADTWSPP